MGEAPSLPHASSLIPQIPKCWGIEAAAGPEHKAGAEPVAGAAVPGAGAAALPLLERHLVGAAPQHGREAPRGCSGGR